MKITTKRRLHRLRLRARAPLWSVAVLLGTAAAVAVAQFPGQVPDQTVLGNISGVPAPVRPIAISALGTGSCGTGTTNALLKFLTSSTCGDSHVTDDGTDIAATAPGGITLTAGGAIAGTATTSVTLIAGTDFTANASLNILLNGGNIVGTGGTDSLIAFTAGNGTITPGTITLTTGSASSGNLSGGAFSAITGVGTGSGHSGSLDLSTGIGDAATGQSGDINITTGAAHQSGFITLTAGDSGSTSQAGGIVLSAGNHVTGGGAGGNISMLTGTSSAGAGGNFVLTGGDGADVASGGFQFTAGATSGNAAGGGFGAIAAAGSGTGDGGAISFGAGAGDLSDGGSINLSANITGTTQSTTPGDAGARDGTLALTGHVTTFSGGSWQGNLGGDCGIAASFQSSNDNDTVGRISVGPGTITACTMNFGRKFNAVAIPGPAYAVPNCFANNLGATPNAISISAISISAVTFTFAVDINTTGGKFSYFCVG